MGRFFVAVSRVCQLLNVALAAAITERLVIRFCAAADNAGARRLPAPVL
jgi:hypothetical protein